MAVTFELKIGNEVTSEYSVERIIEGREEMSALYEYDILVRTTKPCSDVKACLEKRVKLEVKSDGKCIQTVHGIVMEIESTRQYANAADAKDGTWYKWTIRPAFAKACYSLNRLVYDEASLKAAAAKMSIKANKEKEVATREYEAAKTEDEKKEAEKKKLAAESKVSGSQSTGVYLLYQLGQRWGSDVKIGTIASNSISRKSFIQFVQNDESDYNFFCRVMAHWGLGYVWTMDGEKEVLNVVDVCGSMTDVSEVSQTSLLIEPVSSSASMWKVRSGYPVAEGKVAVQNYNATTKTNEEVAVSLHDVDKSLFISEHGGRNTCHGKYVDQCALVGQKASWKEQKGQLDGTTYCVTKISMATKSTGGTKKLEGTVEGRDWPSASDQGIGIVPRPVVVNYSPDISDEALIRMEEPGRVRTRTFMAIVVDVSECGHTEAQNRNLCKVREISCWGAGEGIKLENTMWAEMGSPFADADSGLLARPREGNVLFCLDRGDLSIPIVLASLFRDGNKPPVASLSGTRDTTAVTLRNRSITGEKSGVVADMTPYAIPRSVHSLCTDKPLCSQIQLVGKDNGISPKYADAWLGSKYTAHCAGEIALSLATGNNTVNNLVTMTAFDQLANRQMVPRRRTHFQGINMYSEKDVLLQSSDTQFINAGGAIHLTAAQSISLRVGRNSIVISEKGIEMVNGSGKVENPGAHIAYEAENPENRKIIDTYSNSIVINQSGVGLNGISIKANAYNNAMMTVSQGGSIAINNWGASISSPHTTLTGGAALVDTLMYGVGSSLINVICGSENASQGVDDVILPGKDSEPGCAGDVCKAVFGSQLIPDLYAIASVPSVFNASRFKDLFSVTGSMIDMSPSVLTMSSQELYDISGAHGQTDNALAGLLAMGKSTLGGFLGNFSCTAKLLDFVSCRREKSVFLGSTASEELLNKKSAISQIHNLLDDDVKCLKSTSTYLSAIRQAGKKDDQLLNNTLNALRADNRAAESLCLYLKYDGRGTIGNKRAALWRYEEAMNQANGFNIRI